jgi:hypothetical protein
MKYLGPKCDFRVGRRLVVESRREQSRKPAPGNGRVNKATGLGGAQISQAKSPRWRLAHTVSSKVEQAYRRGDLFRARPAHDGGMVDALHSGQGNVVWPREKRRLNNFSSPSVKQPAAFFDVTLSNGQERAFAASAPKR